MPNPVPVDFFKLNGNMNKELKISKITLGTVQLGLHYGIANKYGQPDKFSSHQLLQYALANGISSLDTARIYGNAEEMIASFNQASDFTIISKFKLSDDALNSPMLALEEARHSVKTSCNALQIDCLPICLFHMNRLQDVDKIVHLLPLVLKTLEDEGLINIGGISVNKPNDLKQIKDWKYIRAVQVPMNVFDSRLLQDNLMKVLINNEVMVFIRSVYLQGLMLMNATDIPAYLSEAIPGIIKLRTMSEKLNRSVKDLAFTFVRDTPGVTSIVIGAETIQQLQENIALLNSPALPLQVRKELEEYCHEIPELIITPALWRI